MPSDPASRRQTLHCAVCATTRCYVCCLQLTREQASGTPEALSHNFHRTPGRQAISTNPVSSPASGGEAAGRPFHTLPGNIVCIDADYVQPEIACFYLVGDSGEYALIETGTNHSLDNLRRALDHFGIKDPQIRYIVPTHVHLDHAGGAGRYLQAFPEAELLVHPRGARHLIDPGKLVASSIQVYGEETFAALYGEIIPAPAARTRVLEDGATFTIGQRTLQAVHTRGHAEHHFCLWDEQTRGWFSGDMFGISYPGLRFAQGDFVLPATTPTQFDPDAYIASVRTLAARNPAMMYLTHFSALPFRPEQVDRLCDQLAHYDAIARTLAAAAGDDSRRDRGRYLQALQDAVIERARHHLEQLTSPEQARAAAQTLTMDAQLNAQGIAFRQAQSDSSKHGETRA